MGFFGFKNFDQLTETELTIYRFVANDIEKTAYMRVRDIAKEAHVSNTSVMRFVHKLGFNSFTEFKVSLHSAKLDQQKEQSDQSLSLHFITKENFPQDIYEKLMVVADKIINADMVIYVGMGSSAALAEYASRQTAAIGINSFCIKDPFYPLSAQLQNTTNNVLITFSVSGRTPEIIGLLNDFVNNIDNTLVSITGNLESSLAKMCHYNLSYKTNEERIHHFYDMTTQVPATYLIENLLLRVRHLLQ